MSSRNPIARRHQLYRALALRGTASVAELCDLLGASPATIRRDLKVLQREGLIARSYGGAAIQPKRPAEQAFAVREQEDAEAKRAIAKAAVTRIGPGETVFLNEGSTAMAVARELAVSTQPLFVATSGINVAGAIAENGNITVCLLGGFVGRTSIATSGPFTEAMIHQINADLALISPDAFDLDQGISFVTPAEAAIARHMMSNAKRRVGLVTGVKFSRHARIVAAAAREVTEIVTEAIDPKLETDFLRFGLEVVVAERGARSPACTT